jgi:hypothetical protein
MIVDEQEVDMPRDAEILSVGHQDQHPVLWARVDPSSERVKRRIFLVGTGHTVPDGVTYINTTFMQSGKLVLHWFRDSI